MILLKTVDLNKQFGDTRACDSVNFVVNKGEFLSLVGSNGAGNPAGPPRSRLPRSSI